MTARTQVTSVDLERIRQRQSLFRLAFDDRRVSRAMLRAQAVEFERWLAELGEPPAPKEDWQCAVEAACYLHAGHAGEHEPGMCECGADMDAHSGGWVLLFHDQFMEAFRATPAHEVPEVRKL